MTRVPVTARGGWVAMGSLIVALVAAPGRAADYFLTIGGGNSPTYNQVSLERNVLFLQGILTELGAQPDHRYFFFGDGAEGGRDVQVRDSTPIPRLNLLLSQILDHGDGWEMQYRAHQIPGLTGASTRKSLTDWFDHIGSRLTEQDRLILYYTGHGGAGRKQRDTNFALWDERPMPVREFVGLLDKVPPGVPVVLVMVQCHAGGFADVIFKGGQSGSDVSSLSDGRRCGFYATVPERPAAGCTADTRVEDYHEYSTYFWEALCGHSRTGKPVEPPDYDHDGKVSFAEAHAYVQLHSNTIDIPVCTSEIFLRALSRTKASGTERLVTSHTSFDRLSAFATPAQAAVLDGLSEELKLYGPDRADAAQRELLKVQKEKENADGDSKRLGRELEGLRNRMGGMLTRKWPELDSPWHPRAAALLKDHGDLIVRTIEIDDNYGQMLRLRDQLSIADDRSLDLDRRWAKCQRFIRLAEDVALAGNLPQVANPEAQERYRLLVAMENGTLESGDKSPHAQATRGRVR